LNAKSKLPIATIRIGKVDLGVCLAVKMLDRKLGSTYHSIRSERVVVVGVRIRIGCGGDFVLFRALEECSLPAEFPRWRVPVDVHVDRSEVIVASQSVLMRLEEDLAIQWLERIHLDAWGILASDDPGSEDVITTNLILLRWHQG